METTSTKVAPPIAFAAAHCRQVGKTQGKEQYWAADIKALRHAMFCKVFPNVLFVETPGEMVFLAGIDEPDGVDWRINPELAQKQAEFIQFLREENDRDDATRWGLENGFLHIEYATVVKATAAYMVARSLNHPFGVGFMDSQGEYQRLKVELGDDHGLGNPRYISFEDMGAPFSDRDA